MTTSAGKPGVGSFAFELCTRNPSTITGRTRMSERFGGQKSDFQNGNSVGVLSCGNRVRGALANFAISIPCLLKIENIKRRISSLHLQFASTAALVACRTPVSFVRRLVGPWRS